MRTRVDVREMLDNSRFGARQWAIVALCAARLVMDGFDVQAMGYVAPAAIREWGIAKETLSPGFGAGLLGMLIGSLVFSALDRSTDRRALRGRPRARLHHAECDGARRRIRPAAHSRVADEDRVVRPRTNDTEPAAGVAKTRSRGWPGLRCRCARGARTARDERRARWPHVAANSGRPADRACVVGARRAQAHAGLLHPGLAKAARTS
ncbi:4-hydroxybenzoate transporter domain protein [Burkholderia oklahomensis]|uniref:4-hydroxybenzoate transporter domain protein n=1 Tax=Burkholderia oklahomensis TaxID=342113 RepID=A0AAI8BDZ0_9BURK|nr:4-hydroxybenzoate transporter domain protein [Burkholderia oklahomensis]